MKKLLFLSLVMAVVINTAAQTPHPEKFRKQLAEVQADTSKLKILDSLALCYGGMKAALLVPLHYRVEKWATKRLVEKNKEIRLAAAKKTIEELENEKH